MQRIASAANKVFATDPQAGGNNVIVLGVQRPAQIVNYRTIGLTPVALAVGLGVGALVALALTLAASVRRRRRDLALLKALGFTNRQLAAAVATQATVAATVGIVVGIPLGIVIGRQVWTLFAKNIHRSARSHCARPVGGNCCLGCYCLCQLGSRASWAQRSRHSDRPCPASRVARTGAASACRIGPGAHPPEALPTMLVGLLRGFTVVMSSVGSGSLVNVLLMLVTPEAKK